MIPGQRWLRPARFVVSALVLAAGLAACGGGTSQFEPYVPERYVAFGDETSVIEADGRRYTVNTLTTTGALDCASDPLWTQSLASYYGFVFRQCNTSNATEFKATMRAVAGAKVDDLTAQIDAQVVAGGFALKTITTVLIGANDILELYGRFPTQNEEQLTAEARARGERLAAQVNRLVDLGARVIVSTVPDMGLSPYALAEKAARTDTDRAALISRLTAAFNGRLRVNMLNDGRFVGLVLADESVQSMARYPSLYALTNATSAVCTVALPACTTQTVVTDGTSSGWLWADATRLTYAGQQRIATQALARASGNPF